MSDPTELYQAVKVSVVLGDLLHLCKLAREAGEDLQMAVRHEYRGDHPYYIRKRELGVADSQRVIDAANAVDPTPATEEAKGGEA